MARKKYEDDTENVHQMHHHLGNSSTSNYLLQDNTNIKLGQQQQQKLKLSNSNNKTNQQSHNKGNKHNKNNTPSSKANCEESFFAVVNQLAITGLTIREMPGDGNCLFRALADQLEGHPRNHLEHRRAVVDFMRKHRPDFEPFVEDDEPFEKYVQSLAQPGTFAGNDAIVAFARLHNVTVVIHQLNSPAWLIHPSDVDTHSSNGREVHIAYHNGDHYNSVRKLGDDSDAPANVKLSIEEGHSGCTNKGIKPNNTTTKNNPVYSDSSIKPQTPPPTSTSTTVTSDLKPNQGNSFDPVLYGRRDEDYWVKDSADIERLVADVMEQTDCTDPTYVRDTLIDFHFDMTSTVDFIVSMSFYMSQSQEDQFQQQQQNAEREPDAPTSESLDIGQTCNESSQEVDEKMSTSIIKDNDEEDVLAEDNNVENHECTPKDPEIVSLSQGIPHEKICQKDGQLPSQNQENIGNTRNYKVKISSRQRKDLKKKERKRESEQRKLRENENPSIPKGQVIVSSNLGSLSI